MGRGGKEIRDEIYDRDSDVDAELIICDSQFFFSARPSSYSHLSAFRPPSPCSAARATKLHLGIEPGTKEGGCDDALENNGERPRGKVYNVYLQAHFETVAPHIPSTVEPVGKLVV